MKRFVPVVLAGLVGLSACADQSPTAVQHPAVPELAASFGTPNDGVEPFVRGHVLVRFRPGAARNEIAEQNRARPREELGIERVWILEVEPGEELEVAANLAKNPNVEFAEPDWILSVVPCGTGDCTPVNTPFFGAKWDLYNSGFITNAAGTVLAETGKRGADMAWLEAREYLEANGGLTGSAVIAILDTGIRATHQDLAGKVIAGRNFVPPTCFLGLCFGTPDPNRWADDQGHGTHVAATAAAFGREGAGIPGVAYGTDIKLVAAKVCGAGLTGCPTSAIANGIRWAADQNVHVMNLSLGGGAAQATIQSALQYAVGKGVLPVCATGNDGTGSVSWPAAFPECMAVGATNWNDERASYSNYGAQVEISAPGGDLSDAGAPYSYILSAYYTADDAYVFMAGTSMATPQVAGLAAVLRATGITNATEIRNRIKATADDLGAPGWDAHFGAGRINIYRALTQADPSIAMTISTRSTIQLRASGNVQVVLLGREAQTFSLEMVDVASIRLGSTPLAMRGNGTHFATWSDVDGDGLADLVLHFSVPALRANGDVVAATRELTLRGTLGDGRLMRATIPVTVLQ
jgi:subtilisin family serine protease